MAATQGEKIAVIEAEIKDMKNDINQQGRLINEIHKMGQIQATQTEQIKTLCNCYEKQNKRLEAIENRPSKRWELIVSAIISAAVAAFVAYFTIAR